MSYAEAIRTLEDALVFGVDPSLEPIEAMCEALGEPQAQYSCIQIAGTNGKTSTARITAALLRAAGLRVGLYTSPHLVRYPERIEVDGKVISDELFARGISAAEEAGRAAGVEPTEFELLTAAALWIFAQEHVDWAVLECGLGGRWDATSVVDPRVAVITGVGLDHTGVLGETLEEIAAEKAAIIRPGARAVFAHDLPVHEIFEAQAKREGVEFAYGDPTAAAALALPAFMPSYQRQNIATALAAAQAALGRDLTDGEIARALEAVRFPGRFEALRKDPLVMIDAAHNPQSAQVLADELGRNFVTASSSREGETADSQSTKPPIPTLLLGVLADKDARGIVRALVPLFDRVVVTSSSSDRAIPAPELARIVRDECGVNPEVTSDIEGAFDLLRDERIIATGSITVAGEVKDIWC